MPVQWDRQGNVSSQSLHQFGSTALDSTSIHYADQAGLLAGHWLEPVLSDETDIRRHLKGEYRTGQQRNRLTRSAKGNE